MQSHKQTLIETALGTVFAFVLSYIFGLIVYPLNGHAFTGSQNMWITIEFTVLSFVRSYWWRRLCNWYFHVRS